MNNHKSIQHGKPPADRAKRTASKPDARVLALMALSDVTRGSAYASLALGSRLRGCTLSPADRKLATSLFYTSLENLLRIRHALAQFVERMPEPLVEDVLTLAAAQILFMDRIPDYAAVSQAVEQIRRFQRDQYAALVNGALRGLIRARDAGEIRWPDRETDFVKWLSITCSTPEHLVARLIEDYGAQQAEAILTHRPEERLETVRPNLTRMDAAAFEEYMRQRGWDARPALVEGAYLLKSPGDLSADNGYRDGYYSIQGQGSMLAALAMQPQRGENLLDACAAPGGKSALMAEIMQNTGRLHAWDVHEHRVELIRAAVKRLRLDNLRPAMRDASVHRPELDESFDGVLVDAPCSGLGVMLDKPDIKYRVSEQDLKTLPELQKRILDACCHYVVPGGRLVYSTCTILKAENAEIVEAFLRDHPEFEPDTDDGWLPAALRPRLENGMIQMMPHADGVEGFFIARMRRKRA